jgi:hypothetical protein
VASFYTRAGGPDLTVPIDGFLVAADASGIYASRTGVEGSDELWWYPIDRSAPVRVAVAPAPDGHRLHYMSDSPLLEGPDDLVQVWHMSPNEGEASLIIQPIPRP